MKDQKTAEQMPQTDMFMENLEHADREKVAYGVIAKVMQQIRQIHPEPEEK